MNGLRRVSDAQLVSGLLRAVGASQAATATIVAHLAEVERRDLHLKAGFSSLFGYVTERLNFSEGAAQRRIQVARLSRRVPEVLPLISAGKLHLAGAALLAPVLTRENQRALLAAASGKSKRAIEAIVADYRPAPAVPDRVRRLPAPATPPSSLWASLPLDPAQATTSAKPTGCPSAVADSPAPPTSTRHDTPVAPVLQESASAVNTAPAPVSVPLTSGHGSTSPASARLAPGRGWAAPASAPRPHPIPLGAARFKIQFTASARTVSKLERAQALLSHRQSAGGLDSLFEQALTLLCEKLEKQRFARGAQPRRSSSAACSMLQPTENTRETPTASEQVPESTRQTTNPGGRHAGPQALADTSAAGAAETSSRTDAAREHDPTSTGTNAAGEHDPTSSATDAAGEQPQADPSPSRHIPHAIRRQVFERDGGRCTFVGDDGHRCGERHRITFHHTRAWARYRRHDAAEIVLLCDRHNQLLAREEFGDALIRLAMRGTTRDHTRKARSARDPNRSSPTRRAETRRSTR